jgi:PTS system nitrogen regulatory IIA component
MGLIKQIKASLVLPELAATSKKEVLHELAEAVQSQYSNLDTQTVFNILQEREALGSTGIGDGIAIPHGKVKNLREITICFGRSRKGLPFDALDGKPTHLFFLLLAPEDAAAPYLSCLAELSRFLKNPEVRERLLHAETRQELLNVFTEAG